MKRSVAEDSVRNIVKTVKAVTSISIFLYRWPRTSDVLAVTMDREGCSGEEGLAILSLPRVQNQNQQVEATRPITASQWADCAGRLSCLLVCPFFYSVNRII